MKKYLVALFAVLGLCQTSEAQSYLDVKIVKNIYVDAVTVVFIDGTSQEYPLGKQGGYSFELDNDVDYLIYYETICPVGATVRVREGLTTFTATLIEEVNGAGDESRNFVSIIR